MANPQDWLIWSYEHKAWWKEFCFGYTKNVAEAGRYTETAARKICYEANRHRQVTEIMVRATDAASFRP